MLNPSSKSNVKNAKFKIGDHVRILKYTNCFGKDYAPNWSEVKFKIPCHGHTLLVILMVKELMEPSMKNNCRKQIKQNLELKK